MDKLYLTHETGQINQTWLKHFWNRYKVLIEGNSKKSNDYLKGRTSENKVVIFPKRKIRNNLYVDVEIKTCNSATLFGEIA